MEILEGLFSRTFLIKLHGKNYKNWVIMCKFLSNVRNLAIGPLNILTSNVMTREIRVNYLERTEEVCRIFIIQRKNNNKIR